MKLRFHGLAVMWLMAGLTLGVQASDPELNQAAALGCIGVNQGCRQSDYDRIRERAEIFARKWPAEIKQQWIQLITSRTGNVFTNVDVIERLFLPTFYPASIVMRKQRFQVLDAQLTLLFADLLMEPGVRTIVQDLSEKNILPNDLHRQWATIPL